MDSNLYLLLNREEWKVLLRGSLERWCRVWKMKGFRLALDIVLVVGSRGCILSLTLRLLILFHIRILWISRLLCSKSFRRVLFIFIERRLFIRLRGDLWNCLLWLGKKVCPPTKKNTSKAVSPTAPIPVQQNSTKYVYSWPLESILGKSQELTYWMAWSSFLVKNLIQ